MLTYEEILAEIGSTFHGLRGNMPLLVEDIPYPCIHVAGTNGKGSVATKIAKALEFSGLRVGLYTSPHLYSFCERIAINGVPISEAAVTRELNHLFQLLQKQGLCGTFFEFATALGFRYFKEQAVDIAVIEVGIGGMRDETNIITPILSVITSIGLDHTQILGETIEEIAQQKAGIIKPYVPIVVGPTANIAAILQKAKEMTAPLTAAPKVVGNYDVENSGIASAALKILGDRYCLTSQAIQKALQMRPPCRFEKRGDVIFDVAHNLEAFKRLFEALHLSFPGKAFRLLFGIAKDKAVEDVLLEIISHKPYLHLVQASTMRAALVGDLAKILKRKEYSAFCCEPSITQGVEHALRLARQNKEILVICGSFYLMKEAKSALAEGELG